MFLFTGYLVYSNLDLPRFIIFFFRNAHFMTMSVLKIAIYEIFPPYSHINGSITSDIYTDRNIALLFFIFYNKCIKTSHLRRLTNKTLHLIL